MNKFFALSLLATLLLAGCSKDPEAAKREFLASGDRYVAAKKYREAIVEYRNAIQQDPRFGTARYKLAEAHATLGELEKAYPEYLRAADLLPADKAVQIKAGTILLMNRQFEEGQQRAEKVLALDPKSVDALILRANALAGLKRVDEALEEAQKAVTADSTSGASYATVGAIELLRGKAQYAEKAFLRAVEVDPTSVPARLALTNFYWAAGRPDEAVAALKGALDIEPTNVVVNRVLASILIVRGQHADAEPYLKASATDDSSRFALADYYLQQGRTQDGRRIHESLAAGTSPEAGLSKLRLAALAKSSGDLASARRHLDEVLAKTPKHVDALVFKTGWLLEDRKLDEALVTAQAAVQEAPDSAPAHLALGAVRNRRGETTEALASFREAARVKPQLVTPDIEISTISLAAGRSEEALQYARSAVAKAPNSAAAQLALARASIARNDRKTAEPIVRQLLKTAPSNAQVLTLAGEMEAAKGNGTAAREAFEKAVAASPGDVSALASLLRLDLQAKQVDVAVARVERAVAQRPKDVALLMLAAETYNAVGQTSKLERPLREAIRLEPSLTQPYGMLAQFYQRQGRVDDALRELDAVLARQPKMLSALLLKGILLQTKGHEAGGIAAFRKALDVDSRSVLALNNLAWLYAEKGENLDEALTMAQAAKAQSPDSVDVTDTLGWVLYKKGLYDLAIASFREAVEKSPNNGEFQYHLGLAYAKKGNARQARSTLLAALQRNLPASLAADARAVLEKLPG